MTPLRTLAGAALAATCGLASAHVAPVLSTRNFVEVGDRVSEMLDTSGLAFSTMIMGSAAPLPAARAASFAPGDGPGTRAPLERPQTITRACSGGGQVAIEVLDADAGGDLSGGDRFRLGFEACVIDGRAISGRSEFVVASHRYEGTSEITELDFRFDALGSSEMRWSGAARAALRNDLRRGTESYRVTYRDLAVTRGAHTMRWNFSVDMVRPPIGDQVARVDGAITVDDLALRLRQDEPYVIGADGHPHAGQATASDRRGARLQIEALRRRYAYRYFRAGNRGETADAASQSRPYGTRD